MIKTALNLQAPNYNSPVLHLRLQHQLGVEAFARQLGINAQTLYQAECGCFPELPHSIIEAVYKLDDKPQDFRKKYNKFVLDKRSAFREATLAAGVQWLQVASATDPPVTALWMACNLTKTQFCKQIAILPASMYRLERGLAKHLGSQVENALREIGITDEFIADLNDMQEDYYYRHDGKGS